MKIKNKARISKSEAFIAMFMVLIVVTMPIVFTALQPEIINGEIKQNSVIDSLSFGLKKVISFFNPFNLIPSVSADSDFGCCPTTKTGAKYQATMLDECGVPECTTPGQINPPCWQRGQQCSLGCCINNQGLCMQNSFQEGCATGSFIPNDASCTSTSMCSKACCIKGMQSFMATNFTCFLKQGVWDQGITNEFDCLSVMEKERLGCCKSFAGCEYLTRQECKESRLGTFFADKKCYDNVPQCNCQLNGSKCIESYPDLYKTDSCGNVYVDEEPAQRCFGFCDLKTNSCNSGTCNETYRNNVDGQFTPKETDTQSAQNGYAWCVYDTAVNKNSGEAPMGSRDWRHYCLYGKDYVEPCADYRQQMCTSVNNYAVCTDNLWQSCVNISEQDKCESSPYCYWWTDFRDKWYNNTPFLNTKIDISKIDNWVIFGTKKEGIPTIPVCFPKVKPGFDDGTNGFKNKELMCEMGSYVCPYKQAYFGLTTENTECLNPEFYTYMAERCNAIGDCGNYINYLGKNTTGFKVIKFDEMPKNGTGRGKEDLGIPDSYSKYLQDVATRMNAVSITPPSWQNITGFGDANWLGKTGLSLAGMAIMAAAVFLGVKAGLVAAGVSVAAGGTIAAGSAIAAGTMLSGGSIAAGSTILSGTITSGTVTVTVAGGSTATWTATASTPILVQTASGGVTTASFAGSTVTTATGTLPTVASGSTATIGAGTTVGAGSAAGPAGAAAGSGGAAMFLGPLMIIAGGILIYMGFKQPPGFSQGAMFAGGSALVVAGSILTYSAFFHAIPGVGTVIAIAGAITAAVIALSYWATYQEKYYEVQCNPSMPPAGSADCELCNGDANRPCSKYRCESLGQACMFVDTVNVSGTNYPVADGRCVAQPNNGKAPYIKEIEAKDVQDDKVVFAMNLSGTTPTTVLIDMSNGTGKGIPDYTQLMIKIKLSEDAVCKWDIQLTTNFSDMDFPYESTVLRKELQQEFPMHQSLPYLYVRCANAYGNANVAAYIFSFKITAGPDLTPPIVLATDRDYYKKFGFNVTTVPLTIYVNENSSCKWDKEDQEYGVMINNTLCKAELTQGGWKCETNLTELISEPSGMANPFYIRCNDSAGNEMQQSYLLTLFASPELKISSVSPENNTLISGCNLSATVPLSVSTSEGSDDGNATCYWSTQGYGSGMQKFVITYGTSHSTNAIINISQNTVQRIYIECIDNAFNNALTKIDLIVYKDYDVPGMVRFYKEGNDLVIKTNESATCSFHYGFGRKIDNCVFAANDTLNSMQFSTTGSFEHRTSWDNKPWYVKCYDQCMNGADKNEDCTIIVPQDFE